MATTLTAGRVRTATLIDRRLGGAALFTLGAGFMTVIMLAASMAPGYDIAGGAISDLGVIPETALLFNASLVAVGVLNLVGGWAILWMMAFGGYLMADRGEEVSPRR